MKRKFKLRTLPAAAMLLWLAFAPLAQAYYNPNSGRWLNRDPIAERGGINLSAWVSNNSQTKIDKKGLLASDFSFTSQDLGARAPEGGNLGLTTLIWGPVTSRVAMPKRCCWVVWANGHATADYWWSLNDQDDPYKIRNHELRHVEIGRSHWTSMIGEIGSFTDTCMSKQRANCYDGLVALISNIYFTWAKLDNRLWDCGDYGNEQSCAEIGPLSVELFGTLLPNLQLEKEKCANTQ